MSPRTGRPPVENPKDKRVGIRLSAQTAKDLEECANALNISKTKVIEKGIQKVKAEIKQKK